MSNVHRGLTSIAAVTMLVASTIVAPAVTAYAGGTSSNPARIGLYGQQSPKYDGVYRQGLTVLALHDSGTAIDSSAVHWLLRQQCGNGSWTSFRSDLTKRCGAADSNATAMAVMALKSLGKKPAATDGINWLLNHQMRGGGWEYSNGWGADSNSTGLVVQALIAMKIDPTTVTHHGSPWDFLSSLQLGCNEPHAKVRGSLDYQPESPLKRNDFATAQVTQALAGTKLPVKPRAGSTELPALSCGARTVGATLSASDAAAGYLGRRLAANSDTIPYSLGGGADYGSTANAVLSLVAAGYGSDQVAAAMCQLEASVRTYALDDKGKILPAAAAVLVLAENATGGHPRNVGGINLVKRLEGSITVRVGARQISGTRSSGTR